jgi:hypothetical protein
LKRTLVITSSPAQSRPIIGEFEVLRVEIIPPHLLNPVLSFVNLKFCAEKMVLMISKMKLPAIDKRARHQAPKLMIRVPFCLMVRIPNGIHTTKSPVDKSEMHWLECLSY